MIFTRRQLARLTGFMRASTLISLLVLSTGVARPSLAQCPEARTRSDAMAHHLPPAPGVTLRATAPGSASYVVMRRARGDSSYRLFGHATITRSVACVEGRQVVRSVARYDWAGGRRTVDSTVALVGSYAPLSERTTTPSRRVTYDFDGLQVRGQMGPPDSLRAIADTLPRPAFNSTDLDMLVAALPLSDTLAVSVPLYDPEFPGFRMARLRVTGRHTTHSATGNVEAWVLTVSQPGRPVMTYRIAVTTHQVIEKNFGAADGPAFRLERLPGA